MTKRLSQQRDLVGLAFSAYALASYNGPDVQLEATVYAAFSDARANKQPRQRIVRVRIEVAEEVASK